MQPMPLKRILPLTCLLAIAAATPAAAIDFMPASTNAAVPDMVRDLRVFYTQPRVFEYLFTGSSSGPNSNAAPLLYFRDLAGNTPTVRISELLGPYTVTGFTPRKIRVFKASVNASLDEDASNVTLRDAAGSNRVLTVNKPLIEPGLMASLVSLASGGWGHMRCGDALEIEGVDVTVIGMTTTSVTIRANAQEVVIPPATDMERKFMLALWETHRRDAEARRRDAEAQKAQALALAEAQRQQAANAAAAADAANRPPPPPISAAPKQTFFYGYEGYYPTVFETVPYTYIWPNGQFRTQQIIVPSFFDHHHDEHGHWRHDH